jgi:hypothetical protein
MGRHIIVAAMLAACATAALAQTPAPIPPAFPAPPTLPLASSSVADSGIISLAPGRKVILTLDEAHKPKLESESADALPDIPVSEPSRIIEDNLDNYIQPYQPQIIPGRLSIGLYADAKRGTVLMSANGTNQTVVYVAAIYAKRPDGKMGRSFTTICAAPAGGFNGQTWEEQIDAMQIVEIKSVTSRGCYDPRTQLFNAVMPAPPVTATLPKRK